LRKIILIGIYFTPIMTKICMFIDTKSPNTYCRDIVKYTTSEDFKISTMLNLSTDFIKKSANKIDIFHFHWPIAYIDGKNLLQRIKNAYAFVYFLKLIKKQGIKIVWTAHNLLPHKRKGILEYWVNYNLTHKAEAVVVHGETAANKIKKLFCLGNKVKIIPYGNYIPKYKVMSKKAARKKLNIQKNHFVYIYFGNIDRYKNVPLLLDSFSQQKNSTLIIYGPLNEESLGKKINNQIKEIKNNKEIKIISIFKPFKGKELDNYLAAADVSVFPFKSITTSGAVILAQSYGNPVISVKKGLIPDLMDNSMGILMDDNSQLLSAMKAIQKKNLVMLGKAALRRAKQQDWKTIGKKYRELYKEILD